VETKLHEIQKAGVRKTLPVRSQPYWKHLEKTGYIGYRKTSFGYEAWSARWRDESGKTHQKTLGRVTLHNDYATAKNAAEAWFARCERGTVQVGTVKEACEAYVANLRVLKPATVHYTEGRFKKFVYDAPIGQKKLDALRQIDIQTWRDSLVTEKRTKVSVNRMLAMFKAAMNYAHEDGMPEPWRKVKKFPVKAGTRENFLTKQQIVDMLEGAPPDLSALLRGYLYTGCRPGELAKARVKHFDPKQATLQLATMKGRDGVERWRHVPLAGEALEFFKRQAKNKLPEAYLLMTASGESWYATTPQHGYPVHHWMRAIQELRARVKTLPRDFCAYDLRHTTISNWLAKGRPLQEVARITGTSPAMIMATYYKWIPTDVGDQLAAINDLLIPKM
jgi:integrase